MEGNIWSINIFFFIFNIFYDFCVGIIVIDNVKVWYKWYELLNFKISMFKFEFKKYLKRRVLYMIFFIDGI